MATMEDLNFKMLMCKAIGHGWEEFTPLMKRSQMGYRLSLLCVNCTTERHDIVSIVDGRLIQREYRYADGYRLAHKYTRDEFRKVLVHEMRQQDRKARRAS